MKNSHKNEKDLWENRKLGASPNYAKKSASKKEKKLDDALGLQIVSIRLQKSLIEEFKLLAKFEGIGYQPLMRQVLTRYANQSKQAKHLKVAK